MHGKGVLVFSDCDVVLDGEFSEGCFKAGTVKLGNFEYIGEISKNKLCGKGKLKGPDVVVEGIFANNTLSEGRVIVQIKEDDTFEDYDGVFEGGQIILDHGDKYKIDVKKGKLTNLTIGAHF